MLGSTCLPWFLRDTGVVSILELTIAENVTVRVLHTACLASRSPSFYALHRSKSACGGVETPAPFDPVSLRGGTKVILRPEEAAVGGGATT